MTTTCTKCHAYCTESEIALGWPLSSDDNLLCPSCLGDEAFCSDCGEVKSACTEDEYCERCRSVHDGKIAIGVITYDGLDDDFGIVTEYDSYKDGELTYGRIAHGVGDSVARVELVELEGVGPVCDCDGNEIASTHAPRKTLKTRIVVAPTVVVAAADLESGDASLSMPDEIAIYDDGIAVARFIECDNEIYESLAALIVAYRIPEDVQTELDKRIADECRRYC